MQVFSRPDMRDYGKEMVRIGMRHLFFKFYPKSRQKEVCQLARAGGLQEDMFFREERALYQMKWKKLGILLLSGCLLAGCGQGTGGSGGQGGSSTVSESSGTGEAGASSEGGSSSEAAGKEKGAADTEDDGKEASSGEESSAEPAEAEATQTPEPTEKPKLYVEKGRFKAGKTIYDDNVRSITALGLKEYKNFKSKELTEQPAEGNVYLVMFLEIRNRAEEALYIHPDCLSAKVDGKEVEHTVLYHSPEHYQTVFQNIEAGDYGEGYVVWEVPKDWKKMVMTFTGFELIGGKRLKLTAMKKDLKDPEVPSKSE